MKRLRGQPLAVLLALLAGWLGARATTWQWPGTLAEQVLSDTALAVEPAGTPIGAVVADHAVTAAFSLPGAGFAPEYQPDPGARPSPPGSYRQERGDMSLPVETLLARLIAALMREREAMAGYPVPVSAEHAAPVDVAASFPPLSAPPPVWRERMPAGRRGGGWLGGGWPGAGWLGSDWPRNDLPGEGWSGRDSAGTRDSEIEPGASDRQVALAAPAGPERRRWSAEAWALLRGGAGEASPGVFAASYGGSQSGAIIRYRLSLEDRRRPTVYLRTTSALNGPAQGDIGVGISARPLASLPIEAGIEGRLTEQGGRWRVRPAALAVTQLAPLDLPMALRAEIYGQAGYVAGKFATPFADGQVRVDRSLAQVDNIEARIGLGVWGGAQKGAARLDAGPGATLSMPLGKGLFGRAAIDWRFRVAGDAEPGSGPALTLSSGF